MSLRNLDHRYLIILFNLSTTSPPSPSSTSLSLFLSVSLTTNPSLIVYLRRNLPLSLSFQLSLISLPLPIILTDVYTSSLSKSRCADADQCNMSSEAFIILFKFWITALNQCKIIKSGQFRPNNHDSIIVNTQSLTIWTCSFKQRIFGRSDN